MLKFHTSLEVLNPFSYHLQNDYISWIRCSALWTELLIANRVYQEESAICRRTFHMLSNISITEHTYI